MATEKRYIDAKSAKKHFLKVGQPAEYKGVIHWVVPCSEIDKIPTVDAVPVDEIKLHHVIIDNEGVPEVKLQIGDRYFLLRTDPVDVREVVHGRWIEEIEKNEVFESEMVKCSECGQLRFFESNFCPTCGADMRERKDNE